MPGKGPAFPSIFVSWAYRVWARSFAAAATALLAPQLRTQHWPIRTWMARGRLREGISLAWGWRVPI